MILPGKEVWFHDNSGTYKGYVEKTNNHTINVLVDDSRRPEGYQLWRVTEYFLSDSADEAVERWNDYKRRLKEFKVMLKQRRQLYDFERGQRVRVDSINGIPYEGMILRINKITLDVNRDDGKLFRVDRAICSPILH